MSQMLKAKELQRLLNNTPSPAHADAKARLAGFVEVITPFDLRFVQRAVSMILNSEAPGVDPKFAIYPPMLAQLCRSLRDKEIERNAVRRGAIAQIEERSKIFNDQPLEVRQAAVAAGLARLTAGQEAETPEMIAERKARAEAYLVKHDARFVDTSPDAMRARLLKPR